MLEADPIVYPRLRPVESFPVQMDGQNLVCIRDPESLAKHALFLNQTLLFLVSRMDGKHALRDIQADFFRATSEILPIEELEKLISQLDEQRYLDSSAFQKFYQELVRAFHEAPSRPAHHAGAAYEDNREKLIGQLQSCFSHPAGPENDSSSVFSKSLRGLIAPHIDFERGGPVYAHACRALAGSPGAETYIIFGTCHNTMLQRFSICAKDYETPLGAAPADQDFISLLSAKIGNEYREEFPHRTEHSIEFQAVWLRFILQGRPEFKIVPILVNSFHDIYSEGRTAGEDPEIQGLVHAIRDTMAESAGRRICVIAGADLAHVGRRFGDASGPTVHSLSQVEREDRSFLKLVEQGDAEGVFRSIASDNDRRRVCGYPPIYMALRCIDQPKGKLLQYQQWHDFEAGAAVTYAALALY
jgi:MEMO1 family protein